MKVDSTASIDCKDAPAQLTASDVTSLFISDDTKFNIRPSDGDTVLFTFLPVLSYDYPVQSNTECIKACCKDVMDTVAKVSLCEGKTYTLPDGYAAKDSGTYYISYKTSKGCDSIAFYHVTVTKNPASLTLSGERCLEGKDSVVLKATGGFAAYNWMNVTGKDSLYTIKRPGLYWVGTSNGCGAKRDSIEVFAKCEFAVYMPNAFTPNGDGLNDRFRVPPSNQNKLVRLQIFNRWGGKVFETADAAKGWDGRWKGKDQPTGVYVYFLSMETLNRKPLTQRGTVTLIR